MRVMRVAFPAAARDAADGRIGGLAVGRSGAGVLTAALVAGRLVVLAWMLPVLMTASGPAEAVSLRIFVSH
jgi:hypothetical protein